MRSLPRYLLALTGPSGVGKSTVSRLLSETFDVCASVPLLTTRGPKAGDDDEYRYVSLDAFHALRTAGTLVAAASIPSRTEVRWYGYDGADIEALWQAGRLPVVITEMHLLEQLAVRYGRRTVLSFGLLPPGNSKRAMLSHLLHRLRGRGRETPEQIAERMSNAIDDLRLFRDRSDLFNALLVNDDLSAVLQRMREHVPLLHIDGVRQAA